MFKHVCLMFGFFIRACFSAAACFASYYHFAHSVRQFVVCYANSRLIGNIFVSRVLFIACFILTLFCMWQVLKYVTELDKD